MARKILSPISVRIKLAADVHPAIAAPGQAAAVGGHLDRLASRGAGGRDSRRAVALTTALRNVGLGLVIVTGNFGGTPAVSAALAYGIVEVLGSRAVALWWGRRM
jgi:BASS family bile acid:Na+ symporter